MKRSRAKAARAELALLACVALSGCAATPAHLIAHTTENRYLAGGTVVVVVENAGGRRAEIVSPCCEQLERSDQNGWRFVGCDGMMCEESVVYVNAYAATEYSFPLATSLPTGVYRLDVVQVEFVQNASRRVITTTNAFHVEECARAVPESDLAIASRCAVVGRSSRRARSD
ncbi:MAG TPA: hypothetical protein VGC79_06450 [Polyangiaceae bacterium]